MMLWCLILSTYIIFCRHVKSDSDYPDLEPTKILSAELTNERFTKCRIHHHPRTVLNRGGENLSSIPNEKLQYFDKYEAISFNDNNLQTIDKQFLKKFPRVTCLDLSQNFISAKKLLPTIGTDRLKILFLNHQKLKSSTTSLNSQHNELGPLDVVYIRLKTLDLSGTHITQLPRNFSRIFPNLITLHLSDNKFKDISAVYDSLPLSLSVLRLESVGLTTLHIKNITSKNVREIFLGGNHFKRLGGSQYVSGTFMLNSMTHVENLSIQNASIQIIEQGFFKKCGSQDLRILDLSFNQIPRINNDTIDLPYLGKLLLSHNRLKNFPKSRNLTKVVYLSLSYNIFDKIPMNLKYLKSLEILTMRGNNITEIDQGSLALPKLRILDLAENQLTFLPQNWSIHLKGLKLLNLESNRFTDLANILSLNQLELLSTPSTSSLTLIVKNNNFTDVSKESARRVFNNNSVNVVCT